MNKEVSKPPRWADRFLSWYCNPKLLEQIQGDVHELFYWRLEEKGLQKARRSFAWDVIRLFRWSNIKRKSNRTQNSNNIAMFKNYFKIGVRNLWKQRMPSTINVVGLSLAIGCCLVAFLYTEFQNNRDQFHEKGDQIYLLTHNAFVDEEVRRYGYMSWAISDQIREEIPGVNNVLKYSNTNVELKIDDRKFSQSVAFTDSGFFDTFSFPIVYGSNDVLTNPKEMAISEEVAERYFGTEYPIGKIIQLEINDVTEEFEVAAVFKRPKKNGSLRPTMVVRYEWRRAGRALRDINAHTFVEVEEGIDMDAFVRNLQPLVAVQQGFNQTRKYEALGLEPITTMAKNSQSINSGLGSMPPRAPMILLACIGLFMLTLATFNYINIATVMATRRVKEIGIRKVIGSTRSQLIVQFLTENLILCTLAVTLGCLLAVGFFIPNFNQISGSNISLDLAHHWPLQKFLVGLLLFLSFASGAYPALIVSRFKPVKIFRGSEKVGGKRRFTMSLLTFQFILAMITIVAGVSSVQNNGMYEAMDWGYNHEDKLVIEVSGSKIAAFRSEILKHPNVEGVSGSYNSLNKHWDFEEMQVGELSYEGQYMKTGVNYPEFMGVALISGRYFDESLPSDLSSSILVNQAFMRDFQLEKMDNQLVTIDSVNYTIVGVLEDYYYGSFQDGIEPAVFKAIPDSMYNCLTIQASEGSVFKVRDELKKTWETQYPDEPFESHFQSEVRAREFEDMRGVKNVLVFTASLATVLAAMGLFGLVSLSVTAKFKDYGIKKVLGASAIALLRDVYKQFSFIVFFAVVAGSLAAVKVVGLLLSSVYGTYAPIDVIPLGLAAILLLSVAVLTINIQMRRVRLMNPAETLRSE